MKDVKKAARKKFWDILVELGDFMKCDMRKEEIMGATLEKLLQEAKSMKEYHEFSGDRYYDKTAVAKYDRFIEKYST